MTMQDGPRWLYISTVIVTLAAASVGLVGLLLQDAALFVGATAAGMYFYSYRSGARAGE